MQGQGIPQRVLSREHHALGRAVRRVRVVRGLSQERLGDLAGLHRNYVGAVERGEINPTFRTLLSLAGGLDLRLTVLLVIYERQLADDSSAR